MNTFLLLLLLAQQPAPPQSIQPPQEKKLDWDDLSNKLGICRALLDNKLVYVSSLEAYAAALAKRNAELETQLKTARPTEAKPVDK